jgi:hypothetical protein
VIYEVWTLLLLLLLVFIGVIIISWVITCVDVKIIQKFAKWGDKIFINFQPIVIHVLRYHQNCGSSTVFTQNLRMCKTNGLILLSMHNKCRASHLGYSLLIFKSLSNHVLSDAAQEKVLNDPSDRSVRTDQNQGSRLILGGDVTGRATPNGATADNDVINLPSAFIYYEIHYLLCVVQDFIGFVL